jgi:hypothetical protein
MSAGNTSAKSRLTPRTAALAAVLSTMAATMALLPATATAATPPTVSTGGATSVTFDSALLHGSVNPKGSQTSYYFQYGLTKAYGLQTQILQAGAGAKAVHVSVAISGLQPLSVYHYRLVAVNAGGPTIGADKTLLTKKVPLSLQILASPQPVTWGGAITVQGTLSGTGNGGREVVLQANAFPFTTGFLNVGNPELTSPTGSFSFNVLNVTVGTEYRVVTTTNPQVTSGVWKESVAIRIAARAHRLHASIVRGRRLVRFSGTVTPAMDGARVGILRFLNGRNILVSGMVARHLSASSSHFERTVRVKRGIYRILVLTKNPALVSTYSTPLFVS